ncbi:bifunctional metallophosphatase/5'-nucleotidase, partial [Proteus terrae]
MNHKYKLVALAVSSVLLAGCAKNYDEANVVDVRVIAMNDFHGALKAPGPNKPGGIEHMATLIKEINGIPVAFIGLTLEGTAAIVTPKGTEGLSFHNEAKTINALVP